ARFRLHADDERYVLAVDFRLRGRGANRFYLQPQLRKAGLAAAERHRAAHLRPLAPHGLLDDRIVAQAILQRRHLRIDLAVDQRLYLGSDVDLEAGERQRAVADGDLRREIGFEPPRRRQRGPRGDVDVAADIRVLVEHLAGEAFDLLADRAVEQAGKRAGDVARLRCKLAGNLQGAADRRRNGKTVVC